MLKFQDNNTTTIATFEDFVLTVYVMIDDLYHQFALPDVVNGWYVFDAKPADSEIITISICGELAGTILSFLPGASRFMMCLCTEKPPYRFPYTAAIRSFIEQVAVCPGAGQRQHQHSL